MKNNNKSRKSDKRKFLAMTIKGADNFKDNIEYDIKYIEKQLPKIRLTKILTKDETPLRLKLNENLRKRNVYVSDLIKHQEQAWAQTWDYQNLVIDRISDAGARRAEREQMDEYRSRLKKLQSKLVKYLGKDLSLYLGDFYHE